MTRFEANFTSIGGLNRFYNTTYTLFAASVILVYIMQDTSAISRELLLRHIEMSIEILESMDECIVAKKAAKMIQRALNRAEDTTTTVEASLGCRASDILSTPFNYYWSPLNVTGSEVGINLPFEPRYLESQADGGFITSEGI
jgi:hypothetical protein